MDWLDALQQLRQNRVPAVLVTITEVRGHAPRDAGTKMVVSVEDAWGTIGGGNLEEASIRRARALLNDHVAAAVVDHYSLSDKARAEHGVQCCGGEVTVLFEPIGVAPSVAVFGMGHVGFEIALLLSRHKLELHLVDSRANQLDQERLAPIMAGSADVRVHSVPVLPELVIAELPHGTHVVVLTHDHAEDLAIIDALLRSEVPASSGLIGSSAKWARFRSKLADLGHAPDVIDRVRIPIGDPDRLGIGSKAPAAIAITVAAELLRGFEIPVIVGRSVSP